jgi:amino acid adenylation domain-containing protein
MTRPQFIDRPHDSTATPLPGSATYRNGAVTSAPPELLHPIDATIEAHPHRIAIQSGTASMTYGELATRSNRLAHWLCTQGVGLDVAVGVSLEKSPEALVAIVAILRAGGIYVPLDPHYPAERLAMMLEDAAPRLVLDADSLTKVHTALPIGPPRVRSDDDHLGYILFTSGSTGRPKGVAMRRGPLRRLIDWQVRNSLAGPGDATLQFASLNFDVSFQEIFSTWATGGTLVLPSEMERRDPVALLRLIESKSIRRLFVPFVMLQHLCEAAQTPPTCLREVITAGEQLQITPAVRRFFTQLPDCSLHNHYGPTEAHVVTAHTLGRTPESWPTLPPIGTPIDSAVIYLVDEAGHRVSHGESGEIWIGGDCLARGYLGRPELTNERFRLDPFRPGGRVYRTGDLGRLNEKDEIEFLGRLDQQVKIRGFRVEPGEIETVLCGHPSVAAAVVVAREDTPGEKRLIAYVVAKPRLHMTPDELRKLTTEKLPDFMVPAAIMTLPSLPLTPSGKVNRQALPAPSSERPSIAAPYVGPRSETEKLIAAIWREVLQLDTVGINDPFFDLGGHSLALARVHVRLNSDLPLAALFQYPTIAALAAALDGKTGGETFGPIHRPSLDEPIAIIGFAGRFPGADSVDAFWSNLSAGVESISRFTDDELRASGIPEHLLANPEYSKARGVLADADCFDAGFFGYQRREAELTDPQHRVFLETAWAALEHAGWPPERIRGRAGVFAGASMNTYLLHSVLARRAASTEFLRDFQSGGYNVLVGNDKDYLATRVAFKLNLRGPAVSVQTACSTSLVAVCEAVESLRSGQCDVALAGGVSVTFPQKRGCLYQEGAITSPDGHCRPFDAEARGTVFGEGAGIVVLKRLSEAQADGDTVYAVIRGVGLSNDGSEKLSYLAPNIAGQAEAVARAWQQAGIDTATVGFIEAHGTGTPMGDPIEVAALAQVFHGTPGSCRLGSVKANIGHMEAAAGVTGLIKSALALHYRRIPATIHYRSPNPALTLDRTPFRVNSETETWDTDKPRRAGVTSLGVGGTNAHVALEEAPPTRVSGPSWPQQLLVVSARSPQALATASTKLADYLEKYHDVDLADAAYTLQVGRRAFDHRRFVVADSPQTAADALRDTTSTLAGSTTPPIAFLFPGQGSQSLRMAVGLYAAEPAFKAQLDLCAELLRPHLGIDLREVLFPATGMEGAAQSRLNQTAITQPALFAIEYSLAQTWMGWGIRPTALFGHSIGEYVAACLAGVMSLEDALSLVARRGALIQACPPGVMLAVRASEADVRATLPPSLDVAAVNGPTQTVVSGSTEAINAYEVQLATQSIQCKQLVTSHAFHSALLDPAVNQFREVVSKVQLRPPQTPFISCVTGTWITEAEATSPDYWASQLRQGVRCADGLRAIVGETATALLEVGPGSTLVNLARHVLPRNRIADAIAGLPRDAAAADDVPAVLTALGKLWQAGVEVDWHRFHALSSRRRIGLPTYPFERQRYWIEPPPLAEETASPGISESQQDVVTEAPSVQTHAAGTLPDVQRLFAELSGCDAAAIEPVASFFELGFDSLFLTQAVQAVQTKFGVRISFRQLLETFDTPAKLAEHLEKVRPAQAPTALPSAPEPAAPPQREAPNILGNFAPIARVAEVDWAPRQLRFLDEFVARYARKSAKSKQHIQDHRRVHADPRTVSGFARMWKEMVYSLVVDRSAGSRIWDIDGNEYIDLLNGFGPDFLGHSPPFVVAAIEKQLRAGYEVGPMSPWAGELAKLICDMTGLDRATFVCTGSEAVQAALRAARTVSGRDQVVTFARDYHGNFDEVLLRGAHDGSRPAMPSAPGVPRSATGNMIVLEYGTNESLEAIRRLAPTLAAVLIEPIQSRRPEWQPREFLREMRKITEQSGTCLIFDEVINGFRLHPGGAQAMFGVRADLATYGKVVGGGMPIGVVAGQAHWMACFDGGWWSFGDDSIPEAGRSFFAGTFVRHPFALTAGVATLKHLKEQGPALQERLNARSDRFVAELNAVAKANGVPLEIVNCGSLMFFRNAQGNKEVSLLFYLLRERGVYILEGFPSYLSTVHTDADLAAVVSAFRDSVAELRSHGFFGANAEVVVPKDNLVPLTEAQRELWLAAQCGDDASRAFNETCTLRFRGPFDPTAFRRAVRLLVERHDALRATFDSAGGGQRFRDFTEIDVPFVDLSSLPDSDRARRLAELQDGEDRAVFDLANGPLLRVRMVQLTPDDHAVLLTAHHIACDGWSYDIILHDLGRLYSAALNAPSATSFADFARRQATRTSPDLAWWRERFTPPSLPVDLPTDRARPAHRTFRGMRITRHLGAERSQAVKQLAARFGCTPYATLLASFHALLHRLSGQSDLVVGIPTAGQTLFENSDLVGHCVHFLPLRQSVSPDRPFADFVKNVKTTLLDAFDHRDFTYVSLLRAMPNLEKDRPLVSVGFNLDPALGDLGFAGLQMAVEKNPKHFVNLELHWNLVDAGDQFILEAEFNTDLFDAATVERWTHSYCELLDNTANQPETPVGDLSLMSTTDRRRILVEWNDTARPIPSLPVHELFEKQSRERPEANAILYADETVSYAQLNRRANQLARALISRGAAPNVPVAILLPRGPDLIVALLATLKAGAAYLPLDSTHPAARNARLVADARAIIVVTQTSMTDAASLGVPIVAIDGDLPVDDTDVPNRTKPDDLAAVMYTSGSTGAPKGVMVAHRGIVRLLINSGYCQLGPDHTLAFLAPIAFDAATFEIWGALLHGGRLAIYPDEMPDVADLGKHLKKHSVDTLWLTAGLFNAIIDRDASILRGVKQLLTGGEAMSLAHARRALVILPDTTIINGYGPTEATTFAATYHLPRQLPDGCDSVPIGRPIGNTTLAVLDSRSQPAPVGVPGELFIGGPGVALGYLHRPELTAERFVASPVPELVGTLYRTGDRVRWRDDGLLEYLGRLDQQVKIRGHRVEPGETEFVLAAHPVVAQCAILVRGHGSDAQLIAYVVARPGNHRDPTPLREHLAKQLPPYMVPTAFVFLDSLPLNANGKLDRSALPAPNDTDHMARPRERVAPRTDAEHDLLAVWADVLGQPDLSITDDFFDLGGHSLKAIELISAVRDRLGHAVPLGTLYGAPTVERLAAVIQNRLEAGSERSLVPLRESGHRPPLFMIAGVGGHVFAFHKFARLLGSDQPCYGVKSIGVDGTRPPPERIEDVAAEYVREIIAVRPDGPCVLSGYSIGAVIAFEVALQLRALGRAVPLLVAFDASAPGYLHPPVLTRAKLHFQNLFLRGGGWAYVRQRLVNLREKWNWTTGRGHRNAPTVPGLTMFAQDSITQVWVALHKAYKQYKPSRKFDGATVVVRAEVVEDWDKFVSDDPKLGWGHWTTGPVHAHSLPIRHLDMFHEPTIFDVARIVEATIKSVR